MVSAQPSSWLAWQLVDSAFPTGGFSHSWGLESAWQHGEIADSDALARFVAAAIVQAGYGALPLAAAAHRAPERLEELDELADAFLTNAVANRASRIQGRAMISTAARVWPSEPLRSIATRTAGLCAHVAPITGVVLGAMGLSCRTAQEIVLFSTARGILAAAVRLGIVGSYEAQRLQAACAAEFDQVIERCGGLDERSLAQTAPMVDIMQAAHDRLYLRLFQS